MNPDPDSYRDGGQMLDSRSMIADFLSQTPDPLTDINYIQVLHKVFLPAPDHEDF